MKHFLLTLLLTFIVGVCSAQTEHMKFKGVPMEGTLQTFTSKLKVLKTEDIHPPKTGISVHFSGSLV